MPVGVADSVFKRLRRTERIDITTRSSRSASPSLSVSRITPAHANTNSPTAPTRRAKSPSLFQFVKKTGPSIRNRVVKLKNLALGGRSGHTQPCGARNCKCCKMISDSENCTYNNTIVNFVGGTCSSYNQGAGKRPRQCCHPKGGNGVEGPRTSKAKCPSRRLPVLLYVFHNSAQNREIHGTF